MPSIYQSTLSLFKTFPKLLPIICEFIRISQCFEFPLDRALSEMLRMPVIKKSAQQGGPVPLLAFPKPLHRLMAPLNLNTHIPTWSFSLRFNRSIVRSTEAMGSLPLTFIDSTAEDLIDGLELGRFTSLGLVKVYISSGITHFRG